MLVDDFSKDIEFVEHYANDEMTATFQVIQFQREFLYQTFDVKNHPGRGYKEKLKKFHKKATEEQVNYPYFVQAIMQPKMRLDANKEKLQTKTRDAIEKMSEYALMNPNFNHGMVKTEIDFQIKELELKKKTEAKAMRRKAQIKALSMGHDIMKMNFFDKEVIRKFVDMNSNENSICTSISSEVDNLKTSREPSRDFTSEGD
jgi:hypothetical protein